MVTNCKIAFSRAPVGDGVKERIFYKRDVVCTLQSPNRRTDTLYFRCVRPPTINVSLTREVVQQTDEPAPLVGVPRLRI